LDNNTTGALMKSGLSRDPLELLTEWPITYNVPEGKPAMRSMELFAGAGGLAIGASLAGFRHESLIEWDQDACDTLRRNARPDVMPQGGEEGVRHLG
jgi:hypothetical protein